MKKITFFIALLFMSVLNAQQSFEIDWKNGVTSGASITIEQGDTVKWIWDDSAPHTVTNKSGSQEVFDSGTLTGQGSRFSYTFTQLGNNPYQCDIQRSMEGVITVEHTMSVTDKFVKNLKFFPNPVKNDLTISALFKVDNYQIYNVLGALVKEGKGAGNVTQVDMSSLNSGLYFVKVSSNNLQSTLKIAKK